MFETDTAEMTGPPTVAGSTVKQQKGWEVPAGVVTKTVRLVGAASDAMTSGTLRLESVTPAGVPAVTPVPSTITVVAPVSSDPLMVAVRDVPCDADTGTIPVTVGLAFAVFTLNSVFPIARYSCPSSQ